ncbi:Uncharacterised protein [uncultured archaeon]|nr:Uncharacterised protein [uncultured archaeon]
MNLKILATDDEWITIERAWNSPRFQNACISSYKPSGKLKARFTIIKKYYEDKEKIFEHIFSLKTLDSDSVEFLNEESYLAFMLEFL